MSFQRQIRELFERTSGLHLLRELPPGIDLAVDLERWAPGLEVRTVLDIGANRGQSALRFASDYPQATIHSVEPADSIFAQLKANTATEERIVCHQVALGAEPAEDRVFVVKNLVSHLAEPDEELGGRETQMVRVDTLDGFCAGEGLHHVNLLKIDTEGHDLQVLQGADRLFRSAAVDCVQVEAGMYPENERHVPLRAFQDWMEERGYCFFGFYEQTHEFNGEPQLRRADVAFVSPEVRRRCLRQPV